MRNRGASPDGEPNVSSNDGAEEMTLSGEPVAGRYKKCGELSDAEFLAVHGKTRAQIAEEKRLVEAQGMEINYLVPPRSTKLSDVIAVFIAHMLPFTLAPFILTIIVVYISYMLLGWLGPLISFLVLFYLTVCRMHYDPNTRRKYQELYLKMARNMVSVRMVTPRNPVLNTLPSLLPSLLILTLLRPQELYLKMARYMVSVRMVTPRDPIPDGPYIFAFHPHGRMFYSTSLIIQSHELWRKHFCPKAGAFFVVPIVRNILNNPSLQPSHKPSITYASHLLPPPPGDFFGSAAGAFFVVPIVRNILNNLGLVSVDKPAIVRTLRNKNHLASNPLNVLGLVFVDKHAIVRTLRNKNHVSARMREKHGCGEREHGNVATEHGSGAKESGSQVTEYGSGEKGHGSGQKGRVTITIGGVKEICLGTSPDYDTLYLMKRKGFIKVAMDEKVGIVPIYNFNENQIFRPEPHWFLAFWEWVNNYVGLGVPGMRGYLQMPMPFRKELLFVVGKPLFAKDGEAVDEFHARYMDALKQLFDTYVPIPFRLLFVVGKPLFAKEGETVDDFHARYVEALKQLFDTYVPISPHPSHKLVIT
ncbi:unnamed protein product [Closterium sp. Naga37s-1]|nr:unnamed protein product [Closterium sp. Naga37s-1]